MDTKIIIVDDCKEMQTFLDQALESVPNVKVTGIASNGSEAIDMIAKSNPDIVILDLEMPVMDGLKALKKIKSAYPAVEVLILSPQTENSSTKIMQALALGAKDYLAKPTNTKLKETREAFVKKQLLPKLNTLLKGDTPKDKAGTTKNQLSERTTNISIPSHQTKLIVIGSSLGGPEALTTLLSPLPADFPIPILVTLHMPAAFTKKFAERLNSKCQLNVAEGQEGEIVEAGNIRIAPGDYHMEIKQEQDTTFLRLHQGPLENSCRPAIDPLFRSANAVYSRNLLGIILTGTGFDGTEGCRLIHESNGYVLAQDERTSASWGMPGSVVKAGYADQVAPIDKLTQAIIQHVANHRMFTSTPTSESTSYAKRII